MLYVATELRPSPIHGIGLFLLEPVKKDGLIWRFNPIIDRLITRTELESLPEDTKKFVERYAPWNKATDTWMLCCDNGRFCNHSYTPSVRSLILSMDGTFSDDVAAYDLNIGDEITANYDDCYDNKDFLEHLR